MIIARSSAESLHISAISNIASRVPTVDPGVERAGCEHDIARQEREEFYRIGNVPMNEDGDRDDTVQIW